MDFEAEVFLEIFDDHNQERELDAQRSAWLCRAGDVCGAHVGAAYLEDRRLDVVVSDSLDMPVADCTDGKASQYATVVGTGACQPQSLASTVESDASRPTVLVPYLQWLASDAVQDGQKTRLESVSEHLPEQPLPYQ